MFLSSDYSSFFFPLFLSDLWGILTFSKPLFHGREIGQICVNGLKLAARMWNAFPADRSLQLGLSWRGPFHSVCESRSPPSHDTARQVSVHHQSSHHSYLLRRDKRGQSVLGWFRCGVALWRTSRVEQRTCFTIAFSWLTEGCYPPTVSSLHMTTWHLSSWLHDAPNSAASGL